MSPVNQPESKSTLVTGAAGFIAFHLIEALLRRGTPVIGIDNFDPFYDKSLKQRNLADLQRIARESGTPFRFLEQDVMTLKARDLPDADFGSVVHLAAKAGVRPSLENPEGYLLVNVQGTLRVLEFCRQREIPELTFASSSSVYGDDTPVPFKESAPAERPVSPYAASKRSGELYCSNYAHLYGLKVVTLRFFTVYGPRQRPDLAIHKFARQILSGEEITLYGDGSTERDYTFSSDISTGILQAMEWIGKVQPGTCATFNLGGSATTSLKRLVSLVEARLGTRARIRWESPQPGDVLRTFADVRKAGTAFGYAPHVGIEEGIARFVEWFESEGPNKKSAA